MPHLLTFHWSNQVIWLPPDLGKSMIRGFSVHGEGVKIWLCLECTTDHFQHWDIMIGLIFNWIILSILNLHGEIHTSHDKLGKDTTVQNGSEKKPKQKQKQKKQKKDTVEIPSRGGDWVASFSYVYYIPCDACVVGSQMLLVWFSNWMEKPG